MLRLILLNIVIKALSLSGNVIFIKDLKDFFLNLKKLFSGNAELRVKKEYGLLVHFL